MDTDIYTKWQKCYGSHCPLLVDIESGNLYFEKFLIKKSLRRYYRSMYLPFVINERPIIILKKE